MKGIILNLLEEVVCAAHGEQVWDQFLSDAGLAGGYTCMGIYPDEDLHALVTAASLGLAIPSDELVRRLGHGAALGFSRRYPHFFTPHRRSIDFVLTLNDVIHPEVRKINPDAEPPEFAFSRVADDELLVEYRSRRGLCALADGMLRGAAVYYRERATVSHEQCTHLRDEVCVMRCWFGPAEQADPDGA